MNLKLLSFKILRDQRFENMKIWKVKRLETQKLRKYEKYGKYERIRENMKESKNLRRKSPKRIQLLQEFTSSRNRKKKTKKIWKKSFKKLRCPLKDLRNSQVLRKSVLVRREDLKINMTLFRTVVLSRNAQQVHGARTYSSLEKRSAGNNRFALSIEIEGRSRLQRQWKRDPRSKYSCHLFSLVFRSLAKYDSVSRLTWICIR